jgi:WD40 repeat protein
MVEWDARNHMKSQAVLVGVSVYDYLPPIPAAANSLASMYQLLTSDLCSWKKGQITVIQNPYGPNDLGGQLLDAYGMAQDVALFYYVGHGKRDEQNELCLGLTTSQYSDGPHIATTSLPLKTVMRALRASGATIKIVILDCCESGVSGSEGDFYASTGREYAGGAYIVTATGKYGQARYESSRDGLTYFTRHFVSVIEQGITNNSEGLTLDTIVSQVRRSLSAVDLPLPSDIRQDLHGFAFARNQAFRPEQNVESVDGWYLNDVPPPPHRTEITCVAFNPLGNLLATGSTDGTVVVQEVSLESKCTILDRIGETNDVRMADAQRRNNAFRKRREQNSFRGMVADMVADEAAVRLAARKRSVTGISFNPAKTEPGEAQLALSGGIKGILFWTRKGSQVDAGIMRSRHILPVFSSDGLFLVTAHKRPLKSGVLKWWDGRKKVFSTDALGRITTIVSSPDAEEVFACGYDDGTVRLWNFCTRQSIGPVMHGDIGLPIRSLTFSPDGHSLAATNDDGLVSLWSIAENSGRLFVADWSGQITKEEACCLPIPHRLIGESAGVSSIAYSPDGTWLATGARDGSIRLWEPSTSAGIRHELIHRVSSGQPSEATTRRITGLTFSPDSKLLVAVNGNGQMFIWRRVRGKATP